MKRLHSFVDREGEARARAVTPHFGFSHPSGEGEEVAHCNSDAENISIPHSGPASPVLLLNFVHAGGSWAEQKEAPYTSSLSLFLS